ncbi:MAG: fatty acyl-AMP ligase [Rhodospirillales bacterium]|nr:fatty acyl-AMP ligase [Rhodospirillales bacterium]
MELTATSNPVLPFRVGTFETIWEGLDYAARGETGCNFFSSRGAPARSLPYSEIRERALDLALRLSTLDLPRGSRFAIVAETSPHFLIFFYACQYVGLIPVPLPLSINLGGHDAHVARLRAMLAAAQPAAAVASRELLPTLAQAAAGLGARLIGTPEDFDALPAAGGALAPFNKDEPCYIQYSSGSTMDPKGVMVSQRAITTNARAIGRDGLRLRAGDRAASWLPLYHDMGLVGFCITPMLAQVSIDYLATSTFAVRPLTWLQLISERRCTIAFSPTFGYELCLRRAAKANAMNLDLSSWRVAGIGGEMIRPDVLEQFAAAFGPHGFDRRAFLPSYGLAEATLAVSFAPLGEGVVVDSVDRDKYEFTRRAVPVKSNGAAQRTRSFVACGSVLPEYAVEIRDDNGRTLPDRTIGRICIQGPSLMEGYYRNPAATRQMKLADGWLDTGDMGYAVGGTLFVTGRRKDMIICNGRNIWPQDLEWAVESLADVRTGSVAAFSVDDDDGDERVVIVVECYFAEPARQRALVQDISAIIHRTAGVHCEVMLVPARTLIFTSSGKLSRAAAKARYLNDGLRAIDVGIDATPAYGFDAEQRIAAAG